MIDTSDEDRSEFELIHHSNSAPEISVLMPLYNQSRFVPDAIESVLAQTGITCEILISDDGSSEPIYDLAIATIRNFQKTNVLQHTVRIRKGLRRLHRDHLALLAEAASADVVMQAHGDDLAEPMRAARSLQAINESGAAMAVSAMTTVDRKGRAARESHPEWTGLRSMDWREVVTNPPSLIGSNQCWRRSAVADFRPLDTDWAPTSHDRIVAFRSWLAGGVVIRSDSLLSRREHSDNWSHALGDTRTREAQALTFTTYYLLQVEVMLEDLGQHRATASGKTMALDEIEEALLIIRSQSLEQIRKSYGVLLRSGNIPIWVTEQEYRLARDGELLNSLKRKARLASPLKPLAQMSRGLRGRLRR